MASDYEQITTDNIRRRGEEFDDIGRLVAEQLYSDRTHFVYELLQNAEDALARRAAAEPQHRFARSVAFVLKQKALLVSHYGLPFTPDDVRAICDILRGTKDDDDTQIGKFGIGFKSVYAFTATPRIHSGDEDFEILRYIRPHAIKQVELKPGETRFSFPFNHDSLSAVDAFKLISDRFRTLSLRTLLFLRHIDTIKYVVEDGSTGSYRRESQDVGSARRVTVVGESGGKRQSETWLLFERSVTLLGERAPARVEIAYLLERDEKTGHEVIQPLTESRLVVFFPTDKETRLGFLVNGPFLTTPARDNIVGHPRNQQLVQEIARLAVDALAQLKRMGLLTVNAIQALPIDAEAFPRYSLFYPVFEAVRVALREAPLLPSHNATLGHISARQAKLVRGVELCQLLTDAQLTQLFRSPTGLAWLSDDITSDRKPELRKYLLSELGVQEVGADIFAGQVERAFLEEQPDEWSARFYAYLLGQPALWRSSSQPGIRPGPLRAKPIIRLENKAHISPFRDDGSPAAYLPGQAPTSLPTVRAAVAAFEQAREFLHSLGLSDPDTTAAVIDQVLPKYADPLGIIGDNEHARDLRDLVAALRMTSADRRKLLIERLRETAFFWASNPTSDHTRRVRPDAVYRHTSVLDTYFDNNPNIWFLDSRYDEIYEYVKEAGIAEQPRVTCRRADSNGYVTLASQSGFHERGVKEFDPDCEVDGLEFALKRITEAKALYLWNELLPPLRRQIRGTIERATARSFNNASQQRDRTSRMGRLLTEQRWLPKPDGSFERPQLISLFGLPEEFERNMNLAGALQMRSAEAKHPLSRELGIDFDPEDLEFLKEHWKDIQNLKRRLERGSNEDEEDDGPVFDYMTALQGAFQRPGSEPEGEFVEPGDVRNPERRRALTEEEIREAQEHEPRRALRFRQVARRVWEAKNGVVRAFLQEQYDGKCQICDAAFSRRDGQPYFNGLYLVSRTQKQWIDRSGNVLCLCPTCCAKFQHGSVEVEEDILDQVQRFRTRREGGQSCPEIRIILCKRPVAVRFTEAHMIELQQLLRAASAPARPLAGHSAPPVSITTALPTR